MKSVDIFRVSLKASLAGSLILAALAIKSWSHRLDAIPVGKIASPYGKVHSNNVLVRYPGILSWKLVNVGSASSSGKINLWLGSSTTSLKVSANATTHYVPRGGSGVLLEMRWSEFVETTIHVVVLKESAFKSKLELTIECLEIDGQPEFVLVPIAIF